MKKCFDLKNNKKRLGLLGAFAFLMGFIFGFSFINGSSFADEDLINFEETIFTGEETIFTGEETENLANIEEDIKDEEISGEELFEKVEEGEDVTKNLEEPGLKLGVFVENMEEIQENIQDDNHHYTIIDQKNPDGSEFTWEDITICDPNNSKTCITLMDRNLGATKAGTTCSSTDNGACGYHYQRGNNYGFKNSGKNGTDEIGDMATFTKATWDDRFDNNGYFGTSFVQELYSATYNYRLDGENHDGVRGGAGDSESNNRGYDIVGNIAIDVSDRQGPCPDGYHVPSAGELGTLVKYWRDTYATGVTLNGNNNLFYFSDNTARPKFQEYFKIPFAGWRHFNYANIDNVNYYATLWTSSPISTITRNFYMNSSDVNSDDSSPRTLAYSVRCFKNYAGVESNTFTVSFDSNGGTEIEDIDVPENEIFTKPKDPIKTGFIFSGWYLSGTETLRDFDNNIVTGDMVLYANWEEIDIVRPICLVEYNPIILTQGDVIAALTGCSEEITGTNLIYTFTGNGNYTFEYKDLAGNTGSTLATVNWIDREKPVCSVEYNPATSTQQEVIATLTGCSEEIIGTNLTYTFTGNGNYTFEYKDLAGNIGSTLTIVNWIYKIGGSKLKKDNCPNGDNSDSYYDGICESTDNTYHKSADDKKNEYYEAYMFAYNNGIIDDNMVYDKSKDFINSNLTRIEMARILTNYAINVLGLKPDEGRIVDFSDLGENFDSSDKNVISLSYQLGIMGINMPNNEYRPYDLVPRSEFVTAFSRMVYGIEDGEDVYYSTHMNYLKNKGIVRDTNPKIIESIGYVLLMLNRTDY